MTDDPIKRAGRVAVLQHVEATFDPLPYDQGAARLYGQICVAVRAAGREPRRLLSDLTIAAKAAGNRRVKTAGRTVYGLDLSRRAVPDVRNDFSWAADTHVRRYVER